MCIRDRRYKDTQNVVLCFFGDGAARQGMLHEVFNMAMLWKLPVVFICENNNYAMGTSVARTSNVLDIYKLADAYDMPGDKVNGMVPEDVHNAVIRAVKRAREKGCLLYTSPSPRDRTRSRMPS